MSALGKALSAMINGEKPHVRIAFSPDNVTLNHS